MRSGISLVMLTRGKCLVSSRAVSCLYAQVLPCIIGLVSRVPFEPPNSGVFFPRSSFKCIAHLLDVQSHGIGNMLLPRRLRVARSPPQHHEVSSLDMSPGRT